MEDKIVTIATHTYSRAQLLKGHLEARGIDCFLSNINLIQSDIAAGVKVNVREQDIKKALEIIDSVKSISGKAKSPIIKKLKQVRKILVLTDFSADSENACQYALALAKKLKAEIMLFHVFYDPAIITEPYGTTYTYQVKMNKYTREIEDKAIAKMEKFSRRLKQQLYKEDVYNIRIVHEVKGGIVDDAIMEFTNTYKPGVVILGTKGKGAKADDIMGSIASNILIKLKVPVLAIPGNSIYQKTGDIKSVLYATDFDQSDFQAIRKLMSLIRPFELIIHCIHIASGPKSEWNKVKMNKLKKHFQQEYSEYNIVCGIIQSENILESLQKYVEEHKVGIISLTTIKRSLFQKLFRPSIAKQMLFHTNVPLLVFHSKKIV